MRIIREAAGVIALWKPAGLATQAPPGIPSAEAWLRQHLHGGDPGGYVGVPHRLDRGVSGVVLFAATPRAARKLSRQFERRQIHKTYLAVVAVTPAAAPHVEDLERHSSGPAASGGPADRVPAGARWHDLLAKVVDEPRARIAAAGEPQAREALTFARLVRRLAHDRLLLELEPVTGRMHQLRIQAAVRGLPMLGDGLYGGPAEDWRERRHEGDDSESAAVPGTERIALHAVRIAYTDPDAGCEVVVEAPLPDAWPLTAR